MGFHKSRLVIVSRKVSSHGMSKQLTYICKSDVQNSLRKNSLDQPDLIGRYNRSGVRLSGRVSECTWIVFESILRGLEPYFHVNRADQGLDKIYIH